VLEVMGMYEPRALGQKWLQKQIARWWFQDGILHEAACLHVNSQQEADYLRQLGFKTPLAVIPVGVDLEKIETTDYGLKTTGRLALNGRPFILYLSRLHPKKGLDLLLRAWARVQKSEVKGQRSEAMLVIAGTGAPEYVHQCRQLAQHLGIAGQCLWAGHVDETEKSWLFNHAQCYVLPTSSENFGNVVAEALAHGTPVITTIHTPWVDLQKQNCGWVVDNTEGELSPALAAAMKMEPAARGAMSEAGKRLVREAHSLELVLKKIDAVYKWVTESGPKPSCVV
jgi:glycosyltransferase involved in cell wall biosynthesis